MALSPETLKAVARLVASAPPLSASQLETISAALSVGNPLRNSASRHTNEAA